jgi:2-polyprenyl-6-methoxyphenol hydroxylase-like FAD-dependent oxidoreductase
MDTMTEGPERPDFAHPAHAEQWFTAEGGFVLMQPPTDVGPMLLAVTAGQDDHGVEVTDPECVRIARWLLRQVCTDAEWRFVALVVGEIAARVSTDEEPW